MKDLIGIRIADSAEEPRVRECALERVVFSSERSLKGFERRIQNFKGAAIESRERRSALDQMQRSALFRSRLRQEQRPGREIERRESKLSWNLRVWRFPLKPPGDHQM